MTYLGAIKLLHELRNADDMPFYYKPAIAEVINVLLMDTQEVKHGRWEDVEPAPWGQVYETCSECGTRQALDRGKDKFCGVCGVKMDGENDEID